MERIIKNCITAVAAMFFGTASGCVMDAHQKDYSNRSYDQNLFTQTALSDYEVFKDKIEPMRWSELPSHFLNLHSTNTCNLERPKGGCGGCVSL
jgi:hypothetical protein